MIETSRYLHIPHSTLQFWTSGKEPIVKLAAYGRRPILSFKNLVECYVVQGIRTMYGIKVQKIRAAAAWMRRNLSSPNPLADYEITTDGVNLFLDIQGILVCISKEGQVAMKPIFEAHLGRVERDSSGIAHRLFPYKNRAHMLEPQRAPKVVMIDPMISFGRPILRGSGIMSSVLAGRYKAGDSIAVLAKSYGRAQSEIREAVEWEIGKAA
ncbi:MAG TPA: DUF433 domain-containing protein [Candidatus Angelobacter sp.]|nr:DUF433 domain-containing protein [Candidatus Angelobacter sp.]